MSLSSAATPHPGGFKCFTCEDAADNYECNRWAPDVYCPKGTSALSHLLLHVQLDGANTNVETRFGYFHAVFIVVPENSVERGATSYFLIKGNQIMRLRFLPDARYCYTRHMMDNRGDSVSVTKRCVILEDCLFTGCAGVTDNGYQVCGSSGLNCIKVHSLILIS